VDIDTVLDWLEEQGLHENAKTFIPIYKRVLESKIQALAKEEDAFQHQINKLFVQQVKIANVRKELVTNLSKWSTDKGTRVETDGAFVLSKESLKILKAFWGINQNLRVQKGHVQTTMDPWKRIYAQATLPDAFPAEFFLYDLDELLELYRKMQPDNIEFYDSYLSICSGDSRARITYCKPEIITYPSSVWIGSNLTPTFTTTISKETIAQLKKYGNSKLRVWSRDGLVCVSAYKFYKAIGETSLSFNAKTTLNLAMVMPGAYELTLFETDGDAAKFIKLQNTHVNITYVLVYEKGADKHDSEWFLTLRFD